ncbi:MAG: DASH family cryptochrome, partial [Myxococcota bacterium]|nr:DASH family cryptochrome [Myxococcota bacterium]
MKKALPAICWFRDDLRIDDNPALLDAYQIAHGRVVPVYIIDPRRFQQNLLKWPRFGPYRSRFLLQSLVALRQKLRGIGSDLIIRTGHPEEVLPELAEEIEAGTVCCNEGSDPEAFSITRELAAQLHYDKRLLRCSWGRTLYPLNALPFEGKPPLSFTEYRRAVERAMPPPMAEEGIKKLLPLPLGLNPGAMPTLDQFGFPEAPLDPRSIYPFKGGEEQALLRLKSYVWDRGLGAHHQQGKQLLAGEAYSSKLSPWLAVGALSPRRLWTELIVYEEQKRRQPGLSLYSLRCQLLRRDYMAALAFHVPEEMSQLAGYQGIPPSPPYERDLARFERWWRGYTGVPLVDAFMRELAATGYISPVGREVVARYLCESLRLDWRWGASCFETFLIDYEPATTWGSWQSIAGVGSRWAAKRQSLLAIGRRVDPDGHYIRYWVPELGYLPSEQIHTPHLMEQEAAAAVGLVIDQSYPAPLVECEPPPTPKSRETLRERTRRKPVSEEEDEKEPRRDRAHRPRIHR